MLHNLSPSSGSHHLTIALFSSSPSTLKLRRTRLQGFHWQLGTYWSKEVKGAGLACLKILLSVPVHRVHMMIGGYNEAVSSFMLLSSNIFFHIHGAVKLYITDVGTVHDATPISPALRRGYKTRYDTSILAYLNRLPLLFSVLCPTLDSQIMEVVDKCSTHLETIRMWEEPPSMGSHPHLLPINLFTNFLTKHIPNLTYTTFPVIRLQCSPTTHLDTLQASHGRWSKPELS